MLRILVKDSAIYALGTIASRLVGFIMIPVYTRMLTPADYGVIETIIRLVDIISLFLALGLAEALLRYYYLPKDEDERRQLVGSTLSLNLVIVVVGSMLTLPLSPVLAYLAFGHDRYAPYVTVSLISMLMGNLMELPLTLWRAEAKAWRFTTISLSKLFSHLVLNIVFLVLLRWGIWGVLLSGLINAVVWSAVLGWTVRRRYGIRWDRSWLRRVLSYGLPLVPASLSQFVLHYSDRFFLTRYATEAELGLYSLAYRFGMLVSVFFGLLSRAWWPWVFRAAAEEESTKHLRRGGALIVLSGAIFCSVVILLARPVIRMVANPSFWDANRYIAPIAIAYWFFISSSSLRVGVLVANRTSSFAAANVVSAVICIFLNAWLISRYSIWGAAYATAISFAVFAFLVWFVAQRVNPLSHDYRMMGVSLLAILLASSIDRHLQFSWWLDFFIRLSICTGISVLLIVFFARNHNVQLPMLSALRKGWARGS